MAITTKDAAEIEKFSQMADSWWDPAGPFKPLHAFNPVRLEYIADMAAKRFGASPMQGKKILDVGCGGGLACEPMARLGAVVTGVDASDKNIAVAKIHAERSGLSIDYQCREIDASDAGGYDVVLALEVVEHVADVAEFLRLACDAVAPGGMIVVATLNRTLKSYAAAIVGAEYVMRWLPRGTHDWNKFIKPYDIMATLEKHAVDVRDAAGFSYNLYNRAWKRGKGLSVNYAVTGFKD